MDARAYFYDSLRRKQERDAQNPILDAAAAGWKSGIDNELASRKSMKDLTLKSAIESSQKSREQKTGFLKDSWLKYDHYITEGKNQRLATPKESLEAFEMALNGQDYPGMTSTLKDVKLTPYESEQQKLNARKEAGVLPPPKTPADDTIKNLNIAHDNLIAQRNTVLRRKDKDGNIDQNAVDLIDQQLMEVENKINQENGLGQVKQREVVVPAEKRSLFGIDWLAKDTPETVTTESYLDKPNMQTAPVRQTPVQQTQQPVAPVAQPQPVLAAQDQAAFKWALANPEDPRSQAILIKLKTKHK